MSVMGHPWALGRLFLSPVSLLDPSSRVGLPVHNLGWVFMPGWFPEKTPEESDGFKTPDENRLLLLKPGGNNDHFLTCFYTSRSGIFLSELSHYPLV